jgi:hypothetical protein
MAEQNYTLGRGKVHVARITDGVIGGFRYIGNTPELSLNIESTSLDHYNSDEGVREKDASVTLEVNRTGSLTTDNISPENMALFFNGDSTKITQALVASSTETLEGIMAGHSYKLGVSLTNPVGYFGIDPTGFELAVGVTPLVLNVDYTVDFDAGLVSFVDTSTVAIEGADVDVTFAVKSSTRHRVISGSDPVHCAMLYNTKNPRGDDCVFYFPSVRLSSAGDYALKGDDWQAIPLSLEILKPEGGEAIYRDNKPVYA